MPTNQVTIVYLFSSVNTGYVCTSVTTEYVYIYTYTYSLRIVMISHLTSSGSLEGNYGFLNPSKQQSS